MIGTFFSLSSGTFAVSEDIARKLEDQTLKFTLVSNKKSRLLRLLETVIIALFGTYDKMHIDTFSGNAFRIAEISSFIAWLRHKKIILTLRGGALPEFYEKHPIRMRKVMANATRKLTPSKFLVDFFRKRDLFIEYLPNSIELSCFPYNRSSIIPHSILWVRAFAEIYNPDIPVKVLSIVREKFPDATLSMIGPDKGLRGTVEKLIKKLKLHEAVEIVGPVQNKNLYKYYQSHEVFLNTTNYESFGKAVMEAASCGIPIVSSLVGEIPFIYEHSKSILTVQSNSPSSYVPEVIKLFESPMLANELSRNARKVAESYDWSFARQKWVEVFSA